MLKRANTETMTLFHGNSQVGGASEHHSQTMTLMS